MSCSRRVMNVIIVVNFFRLSIKADLMSCRPLPTAELLRK